jgi:hypothetical protein
METTTANDNGRYMDRPESNPLGFDGSEVWEVPTDKLPAWAARLYQRAHRHGVMDASSRVAAIHAKRLADIAALQGKHELADQLRDEVRLHIAEIVRAGSSRIGGTSLDKRTALMLV